MTVTELGAAFANKTPAGAQGGAFEQMIAQIITQVLDAVGTQRPPTVNVTSPTVQVAAPNVDVNPRITVQERENTPIVTTNVDFSELAHSLSANTEALRQIHADLQSIVMIAQKPVTKSVHRGNGGLIDTVTESR